MSDSSRDERQHFLDGLTHSHDHGAALAGHERKTRWVVALTLAMMVGELVMGYAAHSLALTADGWHMATHAGALGLSALAYWFARSRAGSSAFSFGTGKVHALAGYTSAVTLALVALWMLGESVRRLLAPEPVAYAEALPVAFLGLVVNLVSVKLLHSDEHHHDHDHDHDHDGGHHHGHHHHDHDHNLRAAYYHVLADAMTSLLAILALLGGRYFGWVFLDAIMGIVGSVVIARWSYGLCRGAAAELLDVVPSTSLAESVRERLESAFEETRVVDLHLWSLGPRARACIVSLATRAPRAPSVYREALAPIARFEHLTIEVHALPNAP
jgi:cation diffusion facilitator family transporter